MTGMRDQSERTQRLEEQQDQNWIDFHKSDVELSLTMAEIARAEMGYGNSEHASEAWERAERGYSTVAKFLDDPKHADHIDDAARQQLDTQLQRLRGRLDEIAQNPELKRRVE